MEKKFTMGVIGLGMGINMLPVNKHSDIPIEVTQIAGVETQKGLMNDLADKYALKRGVQLIIWRWLRMRV